MFIIPVLEAGGGQRFISTLANYLSSEGHHVTIISLRKGESFYELNSDVCLKTLNYVPIETENKLKRFKSRIDTFFELRSEILRRKPDFVYSILSSTNLLTIAAAFFSGIPVYVNDVMSPLRRRTKLERLARKILYRKAEGIICMTNEAKEIIERETGAKNIEVIPRPLKVMDFPESSVRSNTILNVGRLHPDKGQIDLLEAFAKLKKKDWKLVFLGDGPSKGELVQKCKQLNLSDLVSFPGSVANVDSWYFSCSIFAFTSYNEGFPNALSEAMHAQMACVSYDCVSGPKEMIDNQVSGLLVPVGDIDSMAEALTKLIENDKMRQELGRNAHVSSKRFCLDNVANRIMKFCAPPHLKIQIEGQIR